MTENNSDAIFGDTYKIEEQLGAGGGGVVYKAWHTRLQKYVVIKELFNKLKRDTVIGRTEVEALKNVKSPYLPQVFDFIEQNGRIFTVMEFIDGESFDKLLEKNVRFPQRSVIKWYEQLAEAVSIIHANNIAHRDIKPANIMLQTDGNICLIDFNAALVSENSQSVVSRSLGYASPEQYELFNARRAQLEHSQTAACSVCEEKTELLDGETEPTYEKTELISDEKTELLNDEFTKPVEYGIINRENVLRAVSSRSSDGINWFLSDIFSLSATMYHLLSGIAPNPCASKTVPVSKLRLNISEGTAFVIDKSMSISPAERFSNAKMLLSAIRGIYKYDKRWKKSQIQKTVLAFLLPISFGIFASTAIVGSRMMSAEKQTKYYNAVYEIENGDNYRESFKTALELFPTGVEAYSSMAKRLWNMGDYDGCKDFVVKNLENVRQIANNDASINALSKMYYIVGNCYCSQDIPDYISAIRYFEEAISLTKTAPEYYRDYAVALARTGNTKRAFTELEKAQALSLNNESVYLIKGEIKAAENDTSQAIKYFKTTISNTNDDYICWRAYCSADDMLKREGDYKASEELLTEGLNRVSISYIPLLNERLAATYIKSNEYDKATVILSKLTDGASPKLRNIINLVVILENRGDYSEATEMLDKAENLYPMEYCVPMHRAFIELGIQAKLSNADRNYKSVYENYEKAKQLYLQSRAQEDPDMHNLESLVTQLKENGWN